MTFKIIKCENPTIECFCSNIREQAEGRIITIQHSKQKKKDNFIILGKIVKVIHSSDDSKKVVMLIKEVLPNCGYGQKFNAVVNGKMAEQLIKVKPETGDRLGFFKPFIFSNPAPVFKENSAPDGRKIPPKYLLEIGGNDSSVLWFCKKQLITVDEDISKATNSSKAVNNIKKIDNSLNRNGIVNDDGVSRKVEHSLGNQQHSFKMPSDNSRYTYKSLNTIKTNAASGNLGQENLFAIVSQIIKPLSETAKGKSTIICKIVDESAEENSFDFHLHFFTADNFITKQIEQGDLLRLHRVKIEIHNNEVDGRVFNSNDVLLIKKKDSKIEPITSAKTVVFTDGEKRRFKYLKNWYKGFIQRQLSNVVLLADICREGTYQIVCKVVSVPITRDLNVIVRVTDGTAIKSLVPSIRLEGGGDISATEITVMKNQSAYANLKPGIFIWFKEVTAAVFDGLRLMINSNVYPDLVDDEANKIADIKRRLRENEVNNNKTNDNQELHNGEGESNICSKTIKNLDTENCISSESLHERNDVSNKKRTRTLRTVSDTKSCTKSKITENGAHNCTRSKEVGTSPENNRTATRKPLFTANCTDLSDPSEEASDILDCPAQVAANPGPSSDIVTPGNTSLVDLIHLVRLKYCCPRKISKEPPNDFKEPSSQAISNENDNKIHTVRKETTDTQTQTSEQNENKVNNDNTMKMPVVKLTKLTEEQCRSVGARSCSISTDTNSRVKKRLIVNLEDASTVINMFQNNKDRVPKNMDRSKRSRLESESTVAGEQELTKKPAEPLNVITDDVPPQFGADKVSSWLDRIEAATEDQIEDLKVETLKEVLLGRNPEPPDMSKYVTSLYKRIKVFLVGVFPEPTSEPLDLVSGYCYSGCHQLYLLSTIIPHKHIDSNIIIPLCPECYKSEQLKELELFFMVELHVMDVEGVHGSVLVCRGHAERFFNCTAKEYLMNKEIRKSRIQLLLDCIVPQKNYEYCYETISTRRTPLLDICVAIVRQGGRRQLCLVNSTLKLPPAL